MREFVPENAKLIPEEAELVFQGKIYGVYQWPQKMYDGSTETFEMLRRPDTVKIIAAISDVEQRGLDMPGNYGRDRGFVVTRQKQPRKDWFYDFPGGRMDATDKNELEAAKREMREETGLTFRDWKLVNVEQPFEKIDWLVYTFIASDLISQTEQKLDAGEKIELSLLDVDEICELAKTDDSRYLRFKYLDKLKRTSDLLGLPELYKY